MEQLTSLWSFRAFTISRATTSEALRVPFCFPPASTWQPHNHHHHRSYPSLLTHTRPAAERKAVEPIWKNDYVDRCHVELSHSRLSTLTRIKFYRIFFRVTTTMKPLINRSLLLSLIKISCESRRHTLWLATKYRHRLFLCLVCRSCIVVSCAPWLLQLESIKSDVLVLPFVAYCRDCSLG